MKAPIEPEPPRIVVTDLIDRGLIAAPATVFGMHRGKRIEATLTPDGEFVHRRVAYSSPSIAAGSAITTELGNLTAGRNYLSVNGWKFWRVVCPDGEARSLADLREQLLSD